MTREPVEIEAESAQSNKLLIQQACEAWIAGTGTPYDLLAEDMTWTIVGETVVSPVYTSRAAFMEQVMRPFATRIVGRLTPSIHAIYAEGSSVALRAEVDGMALDGKPYHNHYAWFLEMKNKRIQRVIAFVDVKAFNELFERVLPPSTAAL